MNQMTRIPPGSGRTKNAEKRLVYQIFYEQQQRPHLDRSFVPYLNYPNDPVFCEYKVMHDVYAQSQYDPSQLVGFFSWKFGQKTGIDGRRFFEFIDSNPGYDVYFINPFPEAAFLFYNIWHNGEYFHNGLMKASSELLSQAHCQIDIARVRHGLRHLCFCNFWVGNRNFWEKYLAFTQPLYRLVCKDRHFRRIFLHGKADRKSDIPLFPYFMERMFTTLLAADPSIKACPYYSNDIYPDCEKQLVTKLLLSTIMPLVSATEWKSKVPFRDIQLLNSIGHFFYDWLESALQHDNAYQCMRHSVGLLVKNTLCGHKSTTKHEIIRRVHELNCRTATPADIYIFGTGSCAEIVSEYLDKKKFVKKGYFDNDNKKSGTILNGVPVMKPRYVPDSKIIAASMHAKEMYRQLRSLGYSKRRILLLHAAS
jgi:hypothetical protein